MAESRGILWGDGAPALLQREVQLTHIERWLGEACDGVGRVVLVGASAGLGKSALLREAAVRARRIGVRVLVSRGSELERDMSFGVARQLFEGELASLADSERVAVLAGAAGLASSAVGAVGAVGEQSGADRMGVIHGLYWLGVNLADRAPLLLVLDDAHWADAQSLRWLVYLAARIAAAPLLVIAAARPVEPGSESSLVARLAAEEAVTLISLEALDEAAVGELVQAQFGCSPDEEFVRACWTATGGNPFFVRELLRAAAQDGVRPVAAQAALAPQLSTREVARSVLVRLARLGERARRLAEAVAVLTLDAEVRHAAAVCDISLDDALAVADVLADAEILRDSRPLEFIHPIVRAAVYEQLTAGERGRAHRRAAQMLAQEGSPPEQVASHALASEPAADPIVVSWLREAARAALGSGAPDAAARYLRRALDEPPEPDMRGLVQFELGQALAGIDVAGAAASFQNAAISGERSMRLLAQRWRGQTLGFGGRPGEAVAALEQAIELAGGDLELVLLLEATCDFYALGWTGDPAWADRSARLRERAADLEGVTPGERRVLATASIDIARTAAAPAARALEFAGRVRRGLAAWLDADDGVETAAAIGNSGILCDDPAGLARHERAIAEAGRRGRVINVGAGRVQTAQIRLRLGALPEAEADARTSWELLQGERNGAAAFYWWSAAMLIEVLTARGGLDEADTFADSIALSTTRWTDSCVLPWPPLVPVALGQLALAQGRTQEGIELLISSGTWLEHRGWANPSLNPWRACAAPALAMTGRVDEAREVIKPAVLHARSFAAPWALGMALRAAGTVEQGDRGLALLREAAGVLEPAGCRVQHAHALLELGATLRRANHRTQAREHLRAALDLAHRCGATPLAARAREELAATGARPRRVMLTGLESLTASERRIAELAADGQSNPEIAQALFVTRKTVEAHLSHAYTKLDINSREQLPTALAARQPHT
jgi:DNA-binding CsgD family transcriptional regulator